MSKNITIQEGGVAKQLTVDKLKTDLVGGGSCLWVPEGDTNLGTKHISENGTFRASDDGYFGYSEVTVSGVGTATGRDPDTGEEKRVSVDPETGNLEETIIPKSIQITTLPTKINYTNGETINYSGIVVHAYSSTGQDLGEVPFSELVFPVTTADAQQTDEWTDGSGLNAVQVAYTPHYYVNFAGREGVVYCGQEMGMQDERPVAYGDSQTPGTILLTRYNGHNYAYSVSGNALQCNMFAEFTDYDGDGKGHGWMLNGSSSDVAGIDKFSIVSFEEYLTSVPVSTVDPTTVDPSTLHATQTIPVQWPSSDAGTTLETSFTINFTGSTT